MKTEYLLFVFFCIFFNVQIQAQPTITSADMITGTFQFTAFTFNQGMHAPGNGGSNITWDFTNISGTNEIYRMFYGTCPGIPECTFFPQANQYVTVLDNAGNQSADKNLLKLNTVQLEHLGARNNTTNFTLTYTDTPIQLKFPVTYLNSFADTSSSTINGVTTNTNDIITADGYGTIKTPAGTYSNVLRIKKESTITITTSGVPTSTTKITTYSWYKNNREVIGVFSVGNLLSPIVQPLPSRFQYTNNSVVLGTGEVKDMESLVIYPNPTSDFVTVKNEKIIDKIELSDAEGRKISEFKGISTIDISKLLSGVYYLKIDLKNEKTQIKKIIKK
ncbi:secretion protein [Chryseobacterium sp. T16E-39]|uniref:T9SS type A sorting domain-containing protein n=1 Tax=Chryseobacterium sp. T16E-39 TaxID=2015076 RepID=UPI000B5B1C22|nr:T9SS type A sorting domain-containing protein [Chryseobacterium sp. T16E-39]ASK32246.1 secretion protein [Chryseobacterium sp. T16E-39]